MTAFGSMFDLNSETELMTEFDLGSVTAKKIEFDYSTGFDSASH